MDKSKVREAIADEYTKRVTRKCIGTIDPSKPKGQRRVECDKPVYVSEGGWYLCTDGHEWGYL